MTTVDRVGEALRSYDKAAGLFDYGFLADANVAAALQSAWEAVLKEDRDVLIVHYPFVSQGHGLYFPTEQGNLKVLNWRYLRLLLNGLQPAPACVDVVELGADEVQAPFDRRAVFVVWKKQKPVGFDYTPKAAPEQGTGPSYETQAAYYDTHIDDMVEEQQQGRYDVVLNEASTYVQSYARLLSVGCGIGTLEGRLSEKGFDVTGIDLSKGNIEYAKANRKGRYEVRNAISDDLTDLGSFSIIVLCDTLEHVTKADRVTLLKNLSRVMEHRCIVIASFPDGDYLDNIRATDPHVLQPLDEHVNRYELRDILMGFGFQLLKFSIYDAGQGWLVVFSRGA